MRSRVRVSSLAAVLATSVVMALPGITTANAADGVTAPAGAGASGQVITVTVSGSGYTGGSSGTGGGGGRVSVSVPAPCWMEAGMTGKEFYDYVTAGLWSSGNMADGGERPGPWAGYEAFKDDVLGRWYSGVCMSSNWPDPSDLSGFFAFTDLFFPANRPRFVPADATPPTPPVPPVLLREIAVKNLTLPDPQLDWNPKIKGSQGTLVNMDTWFWLNHAPESLAVHAAAGGNEASVTAVFAGMDITAPGEAPLFCAGRGIAYTAGANATDCSLAFRRASVALGSDSTPVTVKTRWTGTWAANGVDQGALTPQPAPVTATVPIRVDEVQTLVTGTG